MTNALDTTPSTIDRIRHDLVGLKMPRALEALDHVVRRLEKGEIAALEAMDILLSEELTLRENSRIKTALRMGRLATVKTLAGFDFFFQPSLDRDRIFTLAQLGFVSRCEVVHFLGPPGTGKSHLAIALAVEAVKAGKSVYSARSPNSSPRWQGPNAKAACRNASASSAGLLCSLSMRSATCPLSTVAAICSSNSSTPATRRAQRFSPQIAASPNGARSSATLSSQPHFSIACFTMRSSSRSKDRVIGSASTPSSCPNTCDQKPPSRRRH